MRHAPCRVEHARQGGDEHRTLLAMRVALLAGLIVLACTSCGGQAPPDNGVDALAERLPPLYDPDSLSARVIPDSDLPPPGTRSLFDQLVAQNGALPYPFESIVEWIAQMDASGRRPSTVLIPHGRSLQKGRSSFADPRVVLSADITPPAGAALTPPIKGRLFLGFVDAADEIEVLSYNEAAGRYEFQLVQDYCAGCTPRIVYAKRNVCLTCHQNASAIFPVRPWEETNATPTIAEGIRAAHPDARQLRGAPVQVRLAAPEAIDNATDIANMVPLAQRIWLDGCGAGNAGMACRRDLLQQALRFALAPGSFTPHDAQALVAQFRTNWPERGFEVPDNDLQNRNPLEDDLYQGGWFAGIKRIVFGRSGGPTATSDDGKLEEFDALPPLPAEFDPLTRRPPMRWSQPEDLDAVYALSQALTAHDVRRLQAAGSLDEVLAAVQAPELEAHLGETPFRRTDIILALLSALGVQALPNRWGLPVEELSAPISEAEPPLDLPADSALKPFETYCFACHRDNPSARLNFMAGPTEADVLARIRDTDSIRDALDYNRYRGTRKAGQLMPPEGSWQREHLEQALAAGEDPLTPMREQVPSLFDF